MLGSFTPKVEKQSNGKYTVKDIPIFRTHADRGWNCDKSWIDETIKKSYQMGNQRTRLIIGHAKNGEEKPAKGFAGNFKRKGDWLFADYQDVPEHMVESFENNEFPNRSIEVNPVKHKIMAVALLGSNSPHFEDIPEMVFSQDGADTIHYKDTQTFKIEVYEMLTDEQKAEITGLVKDTVKESVGEFMESYMKESMEEPKEDDTEKMGEDKDKDKVEGKYQSPDEVVKYQEIIDEQGKQIKGLQAELYEMSQARVRDEWARVRDEWEKKFYSERIASGRVDIADEVNTIMQLPEDSRQNYFDKIVGMVRGPQAGAIGAGAVHKDSQAEELDAVNHLYNENRKNNPRYTYADALRDVKNK